MAGKRSLLPAPSAHTGSIQSQQQKFGESLASNILGAQGKKVAKPDRHRHSFKEWEDLKERFTDLYRKNDKRLEDVTEKIRQEFGFEASSRQYKKKIKEWGLGKHIKATDMQVLAAKRRKRVRDRGVETVFIVRGMTLDNDRLDRFVKREASNIGGLVSPSTDTPAQVIYYTPRAPNNQESHNGEMNDVLIKGIGHHYSTIGAITVVQVTAEKLPIGIEQSIGSFKHAHQQAGHGIACRGRFSDAQKTAQLLWQAHTLIIDLENQFRIPQVGGSFHAPLPSESSPPREYRYWVSPHGTSDDKSQRLVDCVKNSKLYPNIVGAENQGSRSWHLMDSTDATEVVSTGHRLFGHPAVAYPDMDILTLLVKSDETASTAKPALLRICICVDPAMEKQSCQVCHSTCMILDFIDEEGAVKLNVPISGTEFLESISYRANGPDYFSTKIWTGNATWADFNFLFQGMTKLQSNCYSHKRLKRNGIIHFLHSSDTESEEDRWDPNGNADIKIFEPSACTRLSWYCPEENRLIRNDEEWDSDCGSVCTDEESPFEPFPHH